MIGNCLLDFVVRVTEYVLKTEGRRGQLFSMEIPIFFRVL